MPDAMLLPSVAHRDAVDDVDHFGRRDLCQQTGIDSGGLPISIREHRDQLQHVAGCRPGLEAKQG